MATKKKYSGIVMVEDFFAKRRGSGFYKVGQIYRSVSEEAIKYYKSINKLK